MSDRGRILVVDDEVNMARAVAVALERSGYDCRVCHDGREALDSFRRVVDTVRPGLAIADRVPALAAFAARCEARESFHAAPVPPPAQ